MTVKRKRGGQPGNTNALKHGIYSRFYRAIDLVDLEPLLAIGLEEEIAMLRVLIRRSMAQNEDRQDPDSFLEVVKALSTAFGRLGGLVRVQKFITGTGDDKEDILQALAEFADENNLG